MPYNSGKGRKPYKITLALSADDLQRLQAYQKHVRETTGLEITEGVLVYTWVRQDLEAWAALRPSPKAP